MLEYRVDPRSPDSLWLARQLVQQWLVEHDVRHDAVGNLVLATTELCTDAAQRTAEPLVVRTWVEQRDVVLEVDSETCVGPFGDGDNETGPGGDLRLAAALVNEVTLRVAGRRTVVHAVARDVVLPPRSGT